VALEVQVDEDRDLGLEHPGIERLGQVVDRSGRVAAERLLRRPDRGGQEDDRHVTRLGVLLDPRGRLEAVHARHDDVEQDDREFLGEQGLQRLLAGLDGHQDLVQRGQDRVQRDQILHPVVDQEDPSLP